MNRTRLHWLVFFCLGYFLFFNNSIAFAGGAYLSEIATPGSLGTAGVLNVVNNLSPDSAFTNPAGMTGLVKDQIMVGTQILIPSLRFDSSIAEGGESDGGNSGFVSAIPGFYAVKVLSDKFRLGFSIAAPLGGGLDYGDDFVGRYQANRSVLMGVGVSPAMGYKISDSISIGLGATALYTRLDLDISVRQPGFGDGEVSFNRIDDWSSQGYFGLTWKVTDRAMLGFVYRTKSNVDLDGEIKFGNIRVPIINRITSSLDNVKLSFDFPETYTIGLMYNVTDNLKLVIDYDYEEWEQFSENRLKIEGGSNVIIDKIDRNWDDTWHIGAALIFKSNDYLFSTGMAYDSSAVDYDDRTADLPVDEQVKFGMAFGKLLSEKLGYSLGISFVHLGSGRMDQTPQGSVSRVNLIPIISFLLPEQ